MTEETRKNVSREERLAAKLRENLRRRKAQARAGGDGKSDSDAPPETTGATETLPIRLRDS